MKQVLKHFYHTLGLSLVVIVCAFAVLLTIARILSPLVVDRRADIENQLSKALSQPVQIEKISVHWNWFRPVLVGEQVVVFNDARTKPLLKVNALSVSLNILQSLLHGQFRLGTLRISGANLTVIQTTEGDIHINGVDHAFAAPMTSNATSGLAEFTDWLLSNHHFILENINLTWHGKDGRKLLITDLNMMLHNDGGHHLLAGDAALTQKIPSSIHFIVDLTGNWLAKEKIDAKIYVAAEDVVLTQWLQNKTWQNFAVKNGVANFQVWAHWQNNQLQTLQSLFGMNQLALVASDTKKTITFQPFTSNLFWEAQANNQWTLDADVWDLGFSRFNKIPGVTGLTGYVHVTPNSGSLDLKTAVMTADFGAMFKAPIKLDEFNGHFVWQHDASGWTIQGTDVGGGNQDLTLAADFGLSIPADNSGAVINMLAKTKLYSAQHIAHYLPLTVLGPNLVHWLSNSILRAPDVTATLALQGRLADFPFDSGTGTFLIDADVKDLDVDYWTGWPILKHLDGELIFAGRRMDVILQNGQILDTPVHQIQANIPTLKTEVQAILNVNGNVTTDLTQGLLFLQNSPLKTKIGGTLRDVSLKGPMQLQLGLSIPLEKGSVSSKVSGHVTTQNAELSVAQRNMKLSGLNGALDFTKDDIDAPKLTAKLWDKPIAINLTSKPRLRLKLNYEDQPYTLLQDPQGWLLQFHNAIVNGNVLIPHQKDQPLRVNLSSLYIDPDKTTDFSKYNLSEIPPIDFSAQQVRYGKKDFGQVQFQLQPVVSGIKINDLNVTATGGGITADGFWSSAGTRLNGRLATTNIATFFASLGLPAGIAGNGQIDFSLSWPDVPYNPSFKQIVGNMVLKLKQGEIIDIGSSAAAQMGLGRVLVSLSFESLGRQFSSAPSPTIKGFDFDIMQGNFSLQAGNATTTNLFLNGPVAQINIKGRVGLVAKDYDLLLTVTPHVTESLPLVAGVMTLNPVIGAMTWVANKLVGSEVQKIAATHYRMSGPWSNPKVSSK